MTLANVLNQSDNKNSIQSLSRENKLHIGQLLHFCELGAVSPDYPYLAVLHPSAKNWADKMHYERTGQMIHSGIAFLRSWTGEARNKAFVWLLGYASHVIADVTIHPVIEMKVGMYQTHKTDHRVCEMNQDAYIYDRRLNKTEIDVAGHLASGIGLCGDAQNQDNLDRDILMLWSAMLEDVHPDDFASNRPDPNEWHKAFRSHLSLASAAGGRLIPIARHVAAGLGLVYPRLADIEQQFITGLTTPIGTKDYDEIFDVAVENSKTIWDLIARGVFHEDEADLSKIADWNLDTGKDQNGQLGFWS
jgi:hypothetical protein